jgi:hypothetical protein
MGIKHRILPTTRFSFEWEIGKWFIRVRKIKPDYWLQEGEYDED